MMNRTHIMTAPLMFVFILFLPVLLFSEVLYLEVPSLKMGIERGTGLPSFVEIGAVDSARPGKNLMPADTTALLMAEGGITLLSVTRENPDVIRTAWKADATAVTVELVYEIAGDEIRFRLSRGWDGGGELPLTLRIPFNPFVTSTAFFSSNKDEEDRFYLPGVLYAPDYGRVQLKSLNGTGKAIRSRLVGSREDHKLSLLLTFPLSQAEETGVIFSKYEAPYVPGLLPEHRETVERAWMHVFVTRAENDATLFDKPFLDTYRMPMLFANNSLSDPVSSCWFMPADFSFITEDTEILSLRRIVRHSVSYWLENKVTDRGVAIGWTTRDHFLDPNASLLVCAWDYAVSADDMTWLRKYIRRLEVLANYLASRDIDNDGIIEGELPGTPHALGKRGSLSTNAVDAINFGHKDAYSNALAYRGFRCLADLERRLGNLTIGNYYDGLADRLRNAYFKTFYNPKTGMIAGWVDKDGRMVDYRFPFLNGVASYTCVISKEEARAILAKTIVDIKAAGFTNYGFGVPITLDPIEPHDYTYKGLGYPDPELPNKNWQMFLNGGVMQSGQGYYLLGLIRAGLNEEAKRLLDIMLPNQAAGRFQNGIINRYPDGAEVKTWSGETCGYEGYLVHDYYYLLAAACLDKSVMKRLLEPVWE